MTPKSDIEELSAKLHEIYMIEAKRQGDVRHHDDYAMLKESTKEYDRVLARFILEREANISKQLEAAEKMEEALKEISIGQGRYSRDNFEHARNCIEDMKELAKNALDAYQKSKEAK